MTSVPICVACLNVQVPTHQPRKECSKPRAECPICRHAIPCEFCGGRTDGRYLLVREGR